MGSNKNFFDKQTPSSRIKASIVASYFYPYCKIIDSGNQQKEIRYVDLFAGPGLYKDGKPSTPFLIADQIIKDTQLLSKVRLVFNDMNYSQELEENFNNRYYIKAFKKDTRFGNLTVGNSQEIDEYLSKSSMDNRKNKHPSLLFVDPFGYKGINPKVLAKFMENWGNELFLFVNIKRIHAAIKNSKFEDLMKILFPTNFDRIRQERRYTANPSERLNLIMDNLGDEFKSLIGNKLYVTSFKFKEEDSRATSHYLMHLTKHPKGYELIKQTFHDFDNIGASLEKAGTYTYDAKKMDIPVGQIQFEDQNVVNLSNELSNVFARQQVTVVDIFKKHQSNSKYCGTHYVKAIRRLVNDNKASAIRTDNVNHRELVVMSENCKITFK
ncbi:MAG: three-Cys-motif partner protein TcmP [Aureispira sp.]